MGAGRVPPRRDAACARLFPLLIPMRTGGTLGVPAVCTRVLEEAPVSSVIENPEAVSDHVGQSDAVDAVELAEVVEEGIAAAYEQAAGAPVETALETVLEEEQARGVDLH